MRQCTDPKNYARRNKRPEQAALIAVALPERDRPRRVILQVAPRHAPYVLTKPPHPSQQVLKEDADCTIIRIDVVLNFELEREILGFGECMRVLAPRQLRESLARRLKEAAEGYMVQA